MILAHTLNQRLVGTGEQIPRLLCPWVDDDSGGCDPHGSRDTSRGKHHSERKLVCSITKLLLVSFRPIALSHYLLISPESPPKEATCIQMLLGSLKLKQYFLEA